MELQGVITCFAHKIADGFDSHILHQNDALEKAGLTRWPFKPVFAGFKSRTRHQLVRANETQSISSAAERK